MLPMESSPSTSRNRAFISASLSAPSFPSFSPSHSSSPVDRRSSTSSPHPIFPHFLTHSPSSSVSDGVARRTASASSSTSLSQQFAYNARISIALLPAAAFLLDLGRLTVVLILSAGLLLSYLLDSLHLNSASFLSLWLSLVLSQFAFFFSSSLSLSLSSLPLALLSLGLCAETTFLIGGWCSINFRWLRLEHQAAAAALERLLFACIPVVAPALFTWATVSAVGISHAAYYLAAFAALFYWLFSIPRPSSFPKTANADGILGPLESCVHTLYLIFVPVFFHAATHHATVFASWASFCDLLLLFFVPFLFQLYASTRGALWWVTRNDRQMHNIRVMNGAVAVIVVVLCLEVRVVFHSFSKYLHMPPPVNYFLVTLTMMGAAAGLGAQMMGMVGDELSSVVFTVLTVVVSTSGAIVVGFPFMFLPLPIVCGFYLARFFTKRSLSSYFSFVTLASVMVLWFVIHNYWDLNIWIAAMPLKSFCKFIVAGVMMAMVVPGFALLPPKFRFLTEIGLIVHALLLCYIEDRFCNYMSMYYFGIDEEVIYPSYMVLSTTFLGLAVARRLSSDQRIGTKAFWILACLYSAKLPMLFITSRSVVWVSIILLLAISPPLLLYREKSKEASRMKPWQGYFHACVVAVSAWFCRETIFEALQWFNGRAPSDGLLLGSYILLSAISCIPIVVLHFSHVQSAKRALVLVGAVGLLFIVMQPPMNLLWATHSELIRAAHQSNDDVTIYGFVVSKPTWPSWLLLVTIVLTLAAVTSMIPIRHIVELRALYAVGVGITLGIYICAEYFQALILYPLLMATTVCASIFVVFTHLPSSSSTRILPWLFSLLVALFPVTYLLEGELRAPKSFRQEEEADVYHTMLAIEGARMSLLGLYAMIFMIIALEIKYELVAILREKAIDRGITPSHSSRASALPPKTRLMQQRRAHATPTFTIKKLAAEASWMPAIGNVATALCFVICLILNVSLTGGSNRSIFFLAPILLLLNQDSDLFSGFGDRQRYFPVTTTVSGYLILTALYRIWAEVWNRNVGWGLDIGGPGWLFAVKNASLLILTLPNHILFNRFMWDYVKQTDATLLLTLPLNLPSIIITDILTVRILGLLGIIYSLSQYLISRQIRIAGMRYI